MTKFTPDEDAIETSRAFFSRELSDIPTDELYNELQKLREERVPKIQKTKRRTKAEKKATELHALEQHIPPAYREKYRQMSTEEKKMFLQKLATLLQAKQ